MCVSVCKCTCAYKCKIGDVICMTYATLHGFMFHDGSWFIDGLVGDKGDAIRVMGGTNPLQNGL